MAVYEYIALDTSGKSRKGILDADSLEAATQKLRSLGLYPSRLAETMALPRAGGRKLGLLPQLRSRLKGLFQRVSKRDLTYSTRQMSILLNAGLPLESCLSAVIEQSEGTALHRVMAQVRERIKEGSSFAAALQEHPRVFNETYTTMIAAGEASGTLEIVMAGLADFAEQQMELSRKIQSVLAYPLLMLVVGIGVVFFLMVYVIPKVTEIFVDMKQSLPLPTIILINISSFVQTYWMFMPVLFLLMWLGFKRYLKTKSGRMRMHKLALALPVVGPLVHRIAIARFSRTLGTLVKNGVPLLKAMAIVRTVAGNVVLRRAVDEVAQEVSEGQGLSKPLAKRKIFPPTMVRMVSAGEQSGSLDEMLLRLSDLIESEVASRLTILTSLIEPLMILFLGVIVGFVVLSVLLPIFEMSTLLH